MWEACLIAKTVCNGLNVILRRKSLLATLNCWKSAQAKLCEQTWNLTCKSSNNWFEVLFHLFFFGSAFNQTPKKSVGRTKQNVKIWLFAPCASATGHDICWPMMHRCCGWCVTGVDLTLVFLHNFSELFHWITEVCTWGQLNSTEKIIQCLCWWDRKKFNCFVTFDVWLFVVSLIPCGDREKTRNCKLRGFLRSMLPHCSPLNFFWIIATLQGQWCFNWCCGARVTVWCGVGGHIKSLFASKNVNRFSHFHVRMSEDWHFE